MKKQVEMSIQDGNGNEFVAYPKTHKEHVQFENGMNIDEFVGQDIATPTITHDTTAIKVGVGDSDVSSSVVDSTVNMTIKGQTYQNILPEPTLRNEMQGKSMQRLNEGYDNIEVVDGVSKSAILKGQTLVNLVPKKIIDYTASSDWDGYHQLVQNSKQSFDQWRALQDLKPNTKYYISCYVETFDVTEGQYYLLNDPASSSVFSESMRVESTGFYKWLSTTKSELTDEIFMALRCQNALARGAIKIRDIMIIEYQQGMENWDIPYFEGMSSVKMPVLTTVGKNLWNPNFVVGKKINDNGEVELANGHACLENYISVLPNKTYRISNSFSANGVKIFKYDNEKRLVSTSWAGSLKLATESNVKYIRYSGILGAGENTTEEWMKVFQLEEGPTTAYEPYKTNILSCQLAPLNQTMFEQGTFAETTPPNTQSYEQIKLGSEHLYTTRIRTKGTYKVVKGATYEVQLNDGYGIYVCYCKNGLYSATVNRWLDGTSTFTVPNDCDEMFFAIRKTDNTTIVPSDYPHIGLRIHQEVVLRSLPNGIKDTLNLNTGEYVQRIGEVVVDGSNDERWFLNQNLGDGTYHQYVSVNNLVNAKKVLQQTVVSDKLMSSPNESSNNCIWIYDGGTVVIHSSLVTANELKTWLSQNPITVQYELATPVVKTVDLSSSGNWEKIVLDGSDNYTWGITDKTTFWQCKCENAITNMREGALCFGQGDKSIEYTNTAPNKPYQVHINAQPRMVFTLPKDVFKDSSEFKQYLSQNPITVWYQTVTQQDNSIREMLSFANGHLQVSSEAENSLLPSVQYEIPTKNSYHMDLMKANTTYTMKLASGNGSINKWDGEVINFMLSRTFNSGTLPKDNLFYTTGWVNDLMILEGDLNAKTIPYFKGIKSAFEDEDKIEVLSTSHNLWTGVDNYTNSGATIILKYENECIFEHHKVNDGIKVKVEDYEYQVITMSYDFEILDGEALNVGGHSRHETKAFYIDGVKATEGYHNGHVATYQNNRVYHVDHVVHINLPMGQGNVVGEREYIGIEPNRYSADTPTYCKMRVTNFQITLGNTIKGYASPKSNSTKIPLLSPLRSLPNGVCDELIINRLNHKAKLIQRVGVVLASNFSYNNGQDTLKTSLFSCPAYYPQASGIRMCDRFLNYETSNLMLDSLQAKTESEGLGSWSAKDNFNFRILTSRLGGFANNNTMSKWLKDNPTTILYHLKTPIITEIDLEGYPYAYKDGHIFLNSDIAPTTQITYSINQAQQIESANENLQRHEKEISHLQKLIAQYIQVEYESTLLSLKI